MIAQSTNNEYIKLYHKKKGEQIVRYGYIIGIVAAVLILLWALCHVRKKWAYKKVLRLSAKEKCSKLNAALSPYGFCYQPQCGCISSLQDAWQQKMGYCRFYDEASPMMNMVFQCEPVYFTYDNRQWLIELWKGQYGMTAGAEIGVYRANTEEGKRPWELFYEGAEGQEQLLMQFELTQAGQVLMVREERHWWLTGFCVGGFARPDELCMHVQIQFPDQDMAKAYYEGLLRAGYQREEIRRTCCCIAFYFHTPKSRQPIRCGWWSRHILRKNKRRCSRYLHLTECFTDTLDRITYLAYCFPILYRCLIRIGRLRSLKKAHKKYKIKHRL